MLLEKWKLEGGHVYRLAKAFEEMNEAITLAKVLKKDRLVFLTKTDDGLWAVYWRTKKSSVHSISECIKFT